MPMPIWVFLLFWMCGYTLSEDIPVCQFSARDWKHPVGIEGPVIHTTTVLDPHSQTYSNVVQKLGELRPDIQITKVINVVQKAFKVQTFDRISHQFFHLGGVWKTEYVATFTGIRASEKKVFELTYGTDPTGDYYVIGLSDLLLPVYNKYFGRDSSVSGYRVRATPDGGLDSILGENEMKVSFAEKAKTEALSTMKVLSYNLWNFNKDYHERMNKIATFIKTSDPDIIGLQEVRISNWEYPDKKNPSGSQVDDLTSQLPDYHFRFREGMTYFHKRSRIDLYTQEGVAILSKYPIIHTDYIQLSRNLTDHLDEHQRVCLGVTVTTPQGVLSFFTTHSSLSAQARQRNFVELVEFMKKFPEPHILTGDLNTVPGTPELRFLQGRIELGGFKVKYEDAHEVSWSTKTMSDRNESSDDEFQKRMLIDEWTFNTLSPTPRKRIDFLFFTPTAETRPRSKYAFLDDRTWDSVKSLKVEDCWVEGHDECEHEDAKKETSKCVPPSDHRPLLAAFALEARLR